VKTSSDSIIGDKQNKNPKRKTGYRWNMRKVNHKTKRNISEPRSVQKVQVKDKDRIESSKNGDRKWMTSKSVRSSPGIDSQSMAEGIKHSK
jgi:hypothetical protein